MSTITKYIQTNTQGFLQYVDFVVLNPAFATNTNVRIRKVSGDSSGSASVEAYNKSDGNGWSYRLVSAGATSVAVYLRFSVSHFVPATLTIETQVANAQGIWQPGPNITFRLVTAPEKISQSSVINESSEINTEYTGTAIYLSDTKLNNKIIRAVPVVTSIPSISKDNNNFVTGQINVKNNDTIYYKAKTGPNYSVSYGNTINVYVDFDGHSFWYAELTFTYRTKAKPETTSSVSNINTSVPKSIVNGSASGSIYYTERPSNKQSTLKQDGELLLSSGTTSLEIKLSFSSFVIGGSSVSTRYRIVFRDGNRITSSTWRTDKEFDLLSNLTSSNSFGYEFEYVVNGVKETTGVLYFTTKGSTATPTSGTSSLTTPLAAPTPPSTTNQTLAPSGDIGYKNSNFVKEGSVDTTEDDIKGFISDATQIDTGIVSAGTGTVDQKIEDQRGRLATLIAAQMHEEVVNNQTRTLDFQLGRIATVLENIFSRIDEYVVRSGIAYIDLKDVKNNFVEHEEIVGQESQASARIIYVKDSKQVILTIQYESTNNFIKNEGIIGDQLKNSSKIQRLSPETSITSYNNSTAIRSQQIFLSDANEYKVGEIITGSNSGAKGKVTKVENPSSGNKKIKVGEIRGFFKRGETIKGGYSNATAKIEDRAEAGITYKNHEERQDPRGGLSAEQQRALSIGNLKSIDKLGPIIEELNNRTSLPGDE